MVDSKELFEFQERIAKRTRKVEHELREKVEFNKSLEKSFSVIRENLELYEVQYDTLNNLSEVLSNVMKQEELSTIERELKKFVDNFWN